MGPQLGYYYPEIVAADPSVGSGHRRAGRRRAGGDDVRPDRPHATTTRGASRRPTTTSATCSSNSSATPTDRHPPVASTTTCSKGSCRPFETFDAGTLNGTPIRYPVSVHGPVIGTATSNGRPVALTRKRSTFGRDGLNLMALKDMTDGQRDDTGPVLRHRERVRVHLQLGLRRPRHDGLLLVRASSPARTRTRPPAADARHRRIRVARLPQRARAPPRHGRARGAPAELEQPVGARLHAR